MTEASGVPVFCAHDAITGIAELKPNPRNPQIHGERQVTLLATIIRAQGWRAPITVSTRSGYVVKGHGRLLAAQKLGLTEVPVDYQDYDSDEAEHADMIADNRIAEIAELDLPMLKDLLQEIDTGVLDMDLTGYTQVDLTDLLTDMTYEPVIGTGIVGQDDIDRAQKKLDGATDDDQHLIEVECPECGHMFRVREG
jgi:hypothetical protein